MPIAHLYTWCAAPPSIHIWAINSRITLRKEQQLTVIAIIACVISSDLIIHYNSVTSLLSPVADTALWKKSSKMSKRELLM